MTPTQVAESLFATEGVDRFFLIPRGVFLPLGPMRLRSMSGLLRAVDPEVAPAYEIDEVHARRLMKGAITGALVQASDVLQQIGVMMAVFGKAAEQPVVTLDTEWLAVQRAQRLATTLGLSLDDATDHEIVRTRLGELLAELQVELQSDDVLDPEADREGFRERFQRILQVAAELTLAEHEQVASTMPLALRQAFQDHRIQQKLRDVGALLQRVREGAEDLTEGD
jgi:hypothetical protein